MTSSDLSATDTAIAALNINGAAGAAGAQAAMDAIDAAITTVTNARANYGGVQNRFDSVISSLQVGSENLTAARSRIMDADYAVETSNLSRAQIAPNGVLALLR